MTDQITLCLWFDDQAEEAARFFARLAQGQIRAFVADRSNHPVGIDERPGQGGQGNPGLSADEEIRN